MAAPDNTPVGRNFAGTWTDLEGNLWVYGGTGYGGGGNTSIGWRNDLWKFDVITGYWTWVSGLPNALNTAPVYGTQGVPDVANTPGARSHFATWTGADGSLWLYGGQVQNPDNLFGFTTRADLWKYDIPSDRWTWVDGSDQTFQMPVYGTLGEFAEAYHPGTRWESVSWTDAAGNLWLFGGITVRMAGVFPSSSIGNDVWKYDVALQQWAWMKGSNLHESGAVYGTQGVPAEQNTPEPRLSAVGWKDNAGNFWLMGGDVNLNITTSGGMNDVWKFDPLTRNWAWMDGSTQEDPLPVVGVKGVASESNQPSGRDRHAGAADAQGNLWIFGGQGFTPAGEAAALNDTWKYDIATGMWTWVYGSLEANQLGTYGSKGVASPANTPGWRLAASGLSDNLGNIYFFGGHGNGEASTGLMSDLWIQPFEDRSTAADDWQFYY